MAKDRTEDPPVQKAVPPADIPRPGKQGLLLTGLWVVGMFVGLGVPALMVSPLRGDAPTATIWYAFTVTHVGALILLGVGLFAQRHRYPPISVSAAIVSALVVSTAGFIMAGSKLGAF